MYQEKDDRKKYLEQWERVKRWYQRIKKIEQGQHPGSDDDQLDEVHAFFINCFQLRDWIEESRPDIGNEVIDLFKKESVILCFKACRDLANGLKHLKLTSPSIDKNTKVNQQNVTICIGSPITTKYSWGVNNRNVFSLADDCMKEWEKFLGNKKLI